MPIQQSELHFLDTKPVVPTGVTWGVPFARGELGAGEAMHLGRADGTPLPTQHWPLAFWPDGSVKWLGMAAVVGPADGEKFMVKTGAAPAPAAALTIVHPGIEVFRRVETGVIRCDVGDRGRYIIQEIVRDKRAAAGGAELVCRVEHRRRERRCDVRAQEEYIGIIEQLTVEQAGPIRGVIKLSGRYRGEDSGRLWLPFILRLVFHAGCDSIELTHSFVFDGDPGEDFIAGLGLRVHVPLNEGVHNRHVRFVGEDSKGVWTEPVRYLPYVGYHEIDNRQPAQLRGEQVEPPANAALLPAWDDFTLWQDSADRCILRKRTSAESCWIDIDHARRAPGVASLSEPAGGIAIGLRDFWQSHPASLRVSGATTTEAHLTGWWWSPDSPPMDLRHYGTRDYRPIYEAVNPDPQVYSSARGIGRTSRLVLWALAANSTPEDLRARTPAIVKAPLLAASPAEYHRCRVFESWSPVDRSTPARAMVEDELARLMDFYLREQEDRRWYGFWNYGDFMHSYDKARHCWRYDSGGYAWHNTELGADIWPWFNFIRSGRGEVFRFAEAMTRHVSEVDVYHLGRFTAQGTRHNVVHWGCPCKEPRVSQAGAKRFYYYLTADERTRDLLDEAAELADKHKATNVPTEDVYVARVGPTWAAWVGSWTCAWERTGDTRWRDKIMAGIEGILKSPYRLLTACHQFDYDPQNGAMRYNPDAQHMNNRLSATMGGAQVWMDLAALLADERFTDALVDYGRAYALPKAEFEREYDNGLQQLIDLRCCHAHLVAWSALRLKRPDLLGRAWEYLLKNEDGFGTQDRFDYPVRYTDVTPLLSASPRQEMNTSTNQIATWSLGAIACLALAPEALEAVAGGLKQR